MSITELINHPERLDRDTLYELRSMLALYPYYQNARLLLLQNLYLLHDPTFNEELRRAAIYITDRKIIFQMIEAGHYKLTRRQQKESTPKRQLFAASTHEQSSTEEQQDSRTLSLIDDFLDSLPREDEPTNTNTGRKPTPVDATIDYVAYLLESERDFSTDDKEKDTPKMKGQSLIDNFIENEKGKIVFNEKPQMKPELDEESGNEKDAQNGTNTEAMARIYIKQGNYSKALQIIKNLSLVYPKKNIYFADQIRFLEKLIINNNKNKK